MRRETSKHLRPFLAPFPGPFPAPFHAQVVDSKYNLQIKHEPPPIQTSPPRRRGDFMGGVQGKMKTQGSLFKIVKNSKMVTAEPQAKWGGPCKCGGRCGTALALPPLSRVFSGFSAPMNLSSNAKPFHMHYVCSVITSSAAIILGVGEQQYVMSPWSLDSLMVTFCLPRRG